MSLASDAYEFAAAFQGVKPKGSTPTVIYKSFMEFAGKPIAGKYRCYRIWKWVIWDRIWVVKNNYRWSGVCHEMSHALDARYGKGKNERKAEACERAAAEAGRPR